MLFYLPRVGSGRRVMFYRIHILYRKIRCFQARQSSSNYTKYIRQSVFGERASAEASSAQGEEQNQKQNNS